MVSVVNSLRRLKLISALEVGFERVEERCLFSHAFESEISFHPKIECVPNEAQGLHESFEKMINLDADIYCTITPI